VKTPPTDPYAARERHHNEGHGRRLTAAFEALEGFPVLAESRNRVMRLFEAGEPSTSDVVAAVEGDVALAIAVMRLANQVEGRTHGRVETAVKGVEVLSLRSVHAIASRARTFDFFERTAVWQGIPERFRLHAMATQRAADRLARELGYEARDRLMVTSLLHDIGKLVLVHAYPGYPRQIHGDARTPEERIQRERRELGVTADDATAPQQGVRMVGGKRPDSGGAGPGHAPAPVCSVECLVPGHDLRVHCGERDAETSGNGPAGPARLDSSVSSTSNTPGSLDSPVRAGSATGRLAAESSNNDAASAISGASSSSGGWG